MDALLPEILNVPQVAAVLRVSACTIYRLLKRGELPMFRVMSDWKCRRDVLEAWIRDRPKGVVKIKA